MHFRLTRLIGYTGTGLVKRSETWIKEEYKEHSYDVSQGGVLTIFNDTSMKMGGSRTLIKMYAPGAWLDVNLVEESDETK